MHVQTLACTTFSSPERVLRNYKSIRELCSWGLRPDSYIGMYTHARINTVMYWCIDMHQCFDVLMHICAEDECPTLPMLCGSILRIDVHEPWSETVVATFRRPNCVQTPSRNKQRVHAAWLLYIHTHIHTHTYTHTHTCTHVGSSIIASHTYTQAHYGDALVIRNECSIILIISL